MAEILDDLEFWLPTEFLADDDILMDKSNSSMKSNHVLGSEIDYAKPLFPLEFPHGFGSFVVSSDIGSPVDSVVGSTETESYEEDFLAGLTGQMAHSTLEDGFRRNDFLFGAENTKGLVASGSPKSTLCPVGSVCRCKQGSSRGSPNASSRVSSIPATWDLLYAAAEEVARMRMKEGCRYNSSCRGLLDPPRKPSLVSVPAKNSHLDVGLYPQQSPSFQKLRASQFQHLRQQQMMRQQGSGAWGGQAKGSGLYQQQQQTQPVVHGAGRKTSGPFSLPASAWPPLQQPNQREHQGGSGMRAVFPGNPGGKRNCAGTGVFLPRLIATPAESRKKPEKVAQALKNLSLDDAGVQPHFPHRVNGSFKPDNDTALRFRKSNIPRQKRNLGAQPGMKNEVRLPQEWTY